MLGHYLILLYIVLFTSEITAKRRPKETNVIFKRLSRQAIGHDTCTCGQSFADLTLPVQTPLIAKGLVVDPPYKYPWMVGLFLKGKQICGSSIISQRFLLTAAHCFARGKIQKSLDYNQNMCVVDGALNTCNYPVSMFGLSFVGELPEFYDSYPMKRYIIHPKFDYFNTLNDIALIELAKPLPCSKYTRPVCLPHNVPSLQTGTKCVAGGWGKPLEGEKDPNDEYQIETTLQVMSETDCHDWSEGKENYICVIGALNQGICNGDSGGPLVTLNRKQGAAFVVGVASHHFDTDCDSRYPQFFTDLKPYLDWIDYYLQFD